MRYLLVSAAAVMAITGAAAIGNAQNQDDKAKGPAAESTAPGSGGAQRSPGASDKAQQPMPNRTEQKSESRRGAEREQSGDQRREAGRQEQPRSEKGRSKSATKPQRDTDLQRSTEQHQRGNNDKEAADQRRGDKDQKKAAEQRQGDRGQQKSTAQQQRGKDQKKSAERLDGKQAGRVQVSEEKRSGVRERLTKERRVDRIDRARINVSINVGARIPRSVRVHTLPVSIVSFAPAYRGYSYIVLEDDTICIVDPRTYVIVDVIPAGSRRALLTLSRDDMHFIYRTVPKRQTARVRVRLALGAEVPRNVELLAFPSEVVERLPDMRRYRYIVTEDDIVIVDPNDYAVALVIDE